MSYQVPENWDDSSEESDLPDNWDDSSSSESENENENVEEVNEWVDRPEKWHRFIRKMRKVRNPPAVVQDPYKSRIYIEPKRNNSSGGNNNKKGGRKMKKGKDIRPAIIDKRFDDWQKTMAQKLLNGYHVILDVATSCGKTWAVRNIAAEIVLRTDDTIIIVTPNYEIMYENLKAILTDNRKTYQSPGKCVVGFQTGRFNYRADDQSLDCQILCMTAETVTEFMSASVNQDFINRLKFIILDEVHTDEVNQGLWKLSLIPQKVQFLLLSATIGNTEWIAQELVRFRPDFPVHTVQWHVRPIALQRGLIDMEIKLSTVGAKVPTRDLLITKDDGSRGSHLILSPNLIDPTEKDVKYLEKLKDGEKNKTKDEKNRTERYYYGQCLIEELEESEIAVYNQDIEEQIARSLDLDSIPDHQEAEVLLAIFQNINSWNLGPALFLNTDSSRLITIAKGLLGQIKKLENEDKEIRQQMNTIDKRKKELRRKRDGDDTKTKGINNKKNRPTDSSDRGNAKYVRQTPENEDKFGSVDEIPAEPTKWKFKVFDEQQIPRKFPVWMAELLNYGIGIYLESMNRWMKDLMFNWFDQRKLAFILCDRSLSLGINLPVRTVLLSGDIDTTLYKQMGGRAGRRGYDTKGYVFLLTPHDVTRRIMFGEQAINKIEPMVPMNMIDILRWNRKNRHYDFEAINKYKLKYGQVELNKDLVLNKYLWLKKTGWFESKFVNLVLAMEDLSVLALIELIRIGKIDSLVPKKIVNVNQDVEPFMNLLSYLWEPVILDDENDESLKKLDETLIEYFDSISEVMGINVPVRSSVSNYMIRFLKTGENTQQNRESIGKFQRKLFTLLSGFKDMAGYENMENLKDRKQFLEKQLKKAESSLTTNNRKIQLDRGKTREKIDKLADRISNADKVNARVLEENPLLNLMCELDSRLWSWCQQWSVKV